MTSAISSITDPALISSYNRGPLLTAFTAPTSCLSIFTSEPADAMYFGHYAEYYIDSACYPNNITDSGGSGTSAWELYYYSPAVCPFGWSHAKTITSSFGGSNGIFLSIGPSTIAVVCCPLGFRYVNYDHACGSSFSSTTSILYYIKTVIISGSEPYFVMEDGIPIWWQASDLENLSEAPATLTSTSSSPTSTILPRYLGSGQPRPQIYYQLNHNTRSLILQITVVFRRELKSQWALGCEPTHRVGWVPAGLGHLWVGYISIIISS
ncbi:hypothetical protein CJF31_00006096 [Rutstroemia sp. NJR-2017a BVV2]|nr:hypothetical protein CJF31_00010222 [Rutstroemia sp. NJR-2017a BVV2]PQE25229.1 hypothetical protein CJF31_00006096 [Rutstroemia sp. NJR-2017a BVV2]